MAYDAREGLYLPQFGNSILSGLKAGQDMQQKRGELQTQQQLGALAPQIAAGDKGALNQALTLDPTGIGFKGALSVREAQQKQKEGMEAQKKEFMARGAFDILNAPPEMQQAVRDKFLQDGIQSGYVPPEMQSEIGQPLDEEDMETLQQFVRSGQELKDLTKPVNAQSTIGKIEADIKAGRISPKDGELAIKKALTPSGMSLSVGPDGEISFTQGSMDGMQKTTMNTLEDKTLNAGQTRASVTQILNKFKPEYQEFGTKGKMAWSSLKDRYDSNSLGGDERQNLQEFTDFRAEAGQLFANVLKEMSGVAVNPTEFKRAEAYLPNPGTGLFDGDSPTQLEAKAKRLEEFTDKALAKYHYIRKNGLTINDVDVEQMPKIMREKGNELAKSFMAQGLEGDNLKAAVRDELAKEFGFVR